MATTENRAFSAPLTEDRRRAINESIRVAQLLLTDDLLTRRPSGLTGSQVVAAMGAVVPTLSASTLAMALRGCAYGSLLNHNPRDLRVVGDVEPDDLRVNAYVETFRSFSSVRFRTLLFSLLATVKIQKLARFDPSVGYRPADPLLRQLLAENAYVVNSVMTAITRFSEEGPSGVNMFRKVRKVRRIV